MKEYYPDFEHTIKEEGPKERWLSSFKKRNDLTSRHSTNGELGRAVMGTTGEVKRWFEEVYDNIDLSKYQKCNIGNFDETMIASQKSEIVIVHKNAKHSIKKNESFSEHLTLGCLATADGEHMPPLVIMPLSKLPRELDEYGKDGRIFVGGPQSGWIDKQTFKCWVDRFLDWRKARNIAKSLPMDAPFLLFIDLHSSRENSEVLEMLKKENVEVVTIPSHTSHLLQPLDVGVFRHFKQFFRYWRRRFREWTVAYENGSKISEKAMQRYKVIRSCLAAMEQSFITEYIVNGFAKSGLFPKNLEIVLTNPKIIEAEAATLAMQKRGAISIHGAVATSADVIEGVKISERKRALEDKIK